MLQSLTLSIKGNSECVPPRVDKLQVLKCFTTNWKRIDKLLVTRVYFKYIREYTISASNVLIEYWIIPLTINRQNFIQLRYLNRFILQLFIFPFYWKLFIIYCKSVCFVVYSYWDGLKINAYSAIQSCWGFDCCPCFKRTCSYIMTHVYMVNKQKEYVYCLRWNRNIAFLSNHSSFYYNYPCVVKPNYFYSSNFNVS